jgi:hypothetical protein
MAAVLTVMPLVVPVALGVEGDPSSPAPSSATDSSAPVPAPAASPLLEALAFAPSDAASVEWSCWWTNAGASCDVTHGAVEVRASIKYPRWRPRSDADPAVVAARGHDKVPTDGHEEVPTPRSILTTG